MKLILLRHAEAEPYRADDFSRRLTEKGIAQAGHVGTYLAAHKLVPDLMLTSPVIRARETARIVVQKLQEASEDIDLTEVPWLACGMTPERAMEELAAYAKCDCIIIVGHEPDFSSLVAALIGLRSNASMDLSKASLTAIDLTRVAPGSGILRFFLPVKLL
jgi:phosphohistidine phosphatase